MKLLEEVKLNNDKLNNFKLYQLLIKAGERGLIKLESFPRGIIVGDIIFRNVGRDWEPLSIEVKVGYLRVIVYHEEDNGWICPIKTKVVKTILGFIRDLCEVLEDRTIIWNEEQELINYLKVRDKGKDLGLLNSIHIDLGWVQKEKKSSNGGVLCDTTEGPCACGAWH